MANIEAHRNERFRKKMLVHSGKGKNVRSHQINEFDGLIHEPDGTRKFPDGTPVDGSNDGIGYVGLHDDDMLFKPTLAEMEQKEREMREIRAQA